MCDLVSSMYIGSENSSPKGEAKDGAYWTSVSLPFYCFLRKEISYFDFELAIPKLMSGLGTSVKKCPN